jgi:hypothetical protein
LYRKKGWIAISAYSILIFLVIFVLASTYGILCIVNLIFGEQEGLEMNSRTWMASLLMIILLSACGTNPSESINGSSGIPQMIDVGISTEPSPDQLMPHEPVTIQAKVTLNGEEVNDADEVMFEIWQDGKQDQSEKVAGTPIQNGLYTTEQTFHEPGVYYVVSHVTLREMHNMPKLKLVVGEVSGVEPSPEQEQHDGDMKHDSH